MAYETPVATTPLYAGATVTILQAVVQYFLWFTSHPGTSKEALSDILYMQHHTLLPPNNLLPDSYESALKLIESLLIQPITFHVCPNDCVIFRGAYSSLTECPVCHSPRFKDSIPLRWFIYLPLGPRLERMFGTPNLAKIVQCHATSNGPAMYDIHQSPAWKAAYSIEGIFGGDDRGVALGLCTDGVNPFSHHHVSYSMWPIMISLLNLPRHMRNVFGNLVLMGIIPGNGTKEAKTLNPYLNVLVDELLYISNATIYDSYQEAPFQVKVSILHYILDYPGICKVFHVCGSGAYKGCVFCDITGKYVLCSSGFC